MNQISDITSQEKILNMLKPENENRTTNSERSIAVKNSVLI